MELTESLTSFSIYIVTFFSIFINGIFSIPSSQIIYLTLGYLVSLGKINMYMAILIGTIANTLGNIVLFIVVTKYRHKIKPKTFSFLNINEREIEKYNETLKNKWWGLLILAKITPSVKVIVPIFCGLSGMSFIKSSFVFFTGSLIWSTMLISIGYYFGSQVSLIQFYFSIFVVYLIISIFSYFKIKN